MPIETVVKYSLTSIAIVVFVWDMYHAVVSSVAGSLLQFVSGTLAVFGDILLALVYVFALLLYRHKFREFLLRLTRDAEHPRVTDIVDNASNVAR